MIAHAEGARAALKLLTPAIIGMAPTSPELIYSFKDRTKKGYLYAKAVIDIACWDLLGQYARLPLYQLLDGKDS
jgi:L-alanine-DL-glutamate epimerase-like enolase superfamily enzyme